VSDREPIQPAASPPRAGPYSLGIRAAGLLFCAGALGTDPTTGTLVPGGIVPQTERALANVSLILDAGGSGMDRVLKTTVFLTDLGDFAAMNEVYARTFPQPYPARTTVQVAGLPLGAQVEIEVVALAGEEGA